MSKSVRRALLGALLLSCWGQPLSAQADAMTHYALEWLVAAHTYVVEGEVTALRQLPGQSKLFSVSLKTVTPFLKGKSSKGFTAVIAGARLAAGQRVVVFSKTEYAPSSCGRDPRTGKLHFSARQRITRVLDGTNSWAVPTRDFKQTRGLDELRQRIRTAARTKPAKRSITLPIPPGGPISGGALDAGALVVPRDAVTEKYLRTMIASTVTDRRIQGIVMLEAYESGPNIRLLLKLRSDPALRGAAERVLRRWDVPLAATR